jgi:hypothetical protein
MFRHINDVIRERAHMILRSYLYVGVHYKQWTVVEHGPSLCSTTVHYFQQQLVITTYIHSVTILTGANLLETPLFFL